MISGDIQNVKTILKRLNPLIFDQNPRFLIELDLILFTSLLSKKNLEQAIHLAQEKLLPILDSQNVQPALGLKIKVFY